MSLQQLQKKALRELKASPRKAAMLALLAVLAAWFWAPLLLKSSASSTPAPAVFPALSVATAAGPARPAVAAAQGKEQPSWREVAAAIERDPRMTPASVAGLAEKRNPFAPSVTVAQPDPSSTAKEDPEKQPGDDTPSEAEPEDLGLVLTSTLVGRTRRAALIGGRVYELGSKIEVEGQVFVLAEVEPSRVTLERGSRQYPLIIKRRSGGGRIELRPVTP